MFRGLLCVASNELDTGLAGRLERAGWRVQRASDPKLAQRTLQKGRWQVGLLFFSEFADLAPAELDHFLRSNSALEWVGVFDASTLALSWCRELVVEHLFDHHTLPIDDERLLMTLGHAYGHALLRGARAGGAAVGQRPAIVGKSIATSLMARQIARVAKVEAPVLVRGESGSGKDLAARAIHDQSVRSKGPFIVVNCAAIQPSLIQSELFGHTRGAFTGAHQERRGLLESAAGGTVFLDEIGDLPLELQANLLRFLQERTIVRVGATRGIDVDVRVIAATHVTLEEAIAVGAFRADLFYRLNVLSLEVPPLRDRQGDVDVLAYHFFDTFSAEKSCRLKGFSESALAAMRQHRWPGNVRELVNRVRRAMVMAEGRLISPADLELEEQSAPARSAQLGTARGDAERQAISAGLVSAGSNVTLAARQLGVSRMTLYRLMAKHGILQ